MFKKSFQLILFGFAWVPSLAQADLCPTDCPRGYEQVALVFGATDLLEGKIEKSGVKSWYTRRATEVQLELVSSVHEVREKMIQIAQSCKQIRFLGIASHGNAGLVGLDANGGQKNLSHGTLRSTFEGLSCAMAPNAKIEFASCLVGKGCLGQRFLIRMGEILLKKGGTIQAPTIEFSLIRAWVTGNGGTNKQKIVFSSEGKPVAGNIGRYSMSECKEQLSAALNKQVRKHPWFFEIPERASSLQRARADIDELFSIEKKENLNQEVWDKFHIDYQNRFDRIETLKANIKETKKKLKDSNP
jgi:hypothetical protein